MKQMRECILLGLDPNSGLKIFLFSRTSQQHWGQPNLLFNLYWNSVLEVKWLG
jgi:hypothetical protein